MVVGVSVRSLSGSMLVRNRRNAVDGPRLGAGSHESMSGRRCGSMGTGTEAQGAVVHPWAQSGQGRGWGGRGFGCGRTQRRCAGVVVAAGAGGGEMGEDLLDDLGSLDARDDTQRSATHPTVFDVDVEDSIEAPHPAHGRTTRPMGLAGGLLGRVGDNAARRSVTVRFDGGRISSDGGGVLLREADLQIGMTARLSHAKPSLPDDRSQRTPVQLVVIGDDDLGEWMVSAENHVAPVLPLQVVPSFAKRLGAGSPRDPWKSGQTATTNASKCSSGTGSPSSSSEAMYPSMASLGIARLVVASEAVYRRAALGGGEHELGHGLGKRSPHAVHDAEERHPATARCRRQHTVQDASLLGDSTMGTGRRSMPSESR